MGMQEQPIYRVLMSREGSDADHGALHDVPATLLTEPAVGECVKAYFDDGKWLSTSPVKRVANDESEVIVETKNSTYHLRRVRRAA